MVQQEAVSVEPGLNFHAVRLANGDVLQAHALILAAGGSARRLNVPGETENFGKGVSYCATCDGFFFRDKTIVAVGGGDTALEDALYPDKITNHVTLVHRRDAFRASRILQQRVMGEGVDPTQMWQRLVNKVAESKQLMAMTDPDLLVLFEDWFEELAEEIVSLINEHGPLDPEELAAKTGLSRRGATFLISKRKREAKL
jgi:thioredoxin reductase